MEKSQDQPNNSKERAYNEKCDGDKDAVLEIKERDDTAMPKTNTSGVETKLPKLPLPNINETMEKYLDAVVAYISSDDYERTKNHVNEFLSHEDDLDKINRFLEKRNEENKNWAYRWWLEDMYLSNMLPLPVNSSPGWVFPRQDFEGRTDLMHKYLARIISGISEFKQCLESETLEPEVINSRATGKQPLCMEQFGRLVNAYRMPGLKEQDELVCSSPTELHDTEHVIVFRNGYMYVMYIKVDKKWLSVEEVQKGLNFIHEDAKARGKTYNPMIHRVQILTSGIRSTWATHREKLINVTESNKEMLHMIEQCMFVVCLDQSIHNLSDRSVSHQDMFRQMVTGHGCNKNGANRWFDKTIQLVASLDGVNGICYEHTTSEGIAVVTMLQKVLIKMENDDSGKITSEEESKVLLESNKDDKWAVKVMSDLSLQDKNVIKRIDWNLNQEISDDIIKAVEKYNTLDRDTDLEIHRYDGYGKNFIKTCNCSPDAYMQMVLQLAYFKIHGGLCATYESASIRRFQSGRVDSIRSSHPEALTWVKSMVGEGEQSETDNRVKKRKLFMLAITKQTKVMTDNITGKGLDNPMLGIRRAVNEIWNSSSGLDSETNSDNTKHLRAIFQDPVFDTANKFKLSTSQVPISLRDSYMGYGAVVPDGYGCSYNLQQGFVIFCIGSFFSCEETSSLLFAEAIEESMDQMKEMFSDKE